MDIVDLEEIIEKWAWKMFDFTKSKEQGKLPREALLMNINWKRVKFVHGEPQYNDQTKPTKPKAQVLFKTHFTNNTDLDQEYNFKTERITRSVCEVEVEKGVSIGYEVSCKLQTPCSVFEANAGFKKDIEVRNSLGEKLEEELIWSVDSLIKVPPKHKALAELIINEDEFHGKFVINSRFQGNVHVSITNLKDNQSLVKSIDGNVAEIFKKEMETGLKGFRIEKNMVCFDTTGQCHFRFGIEQHVNLHQEPIEGK